MLTLALLLESANGFPSGPDAPFVDRSGQAWRVRNWTESGRLQPAKPVGMIHVDAVGGVPGFSVSLRAPIRTAPPANLPLDPRTPVFVMADTHGEYEIMATLLRRQGIVDRDLRWRFGNGRLVVLGDMLDRGAHQTEILWLLYKLEGEARASGGAVHVLIGNHEAMNLRGDLRYLHPKYPATASLLGFSSYREVLGSDTLLGAWLRSRPTILKLGDLLFLHGGVSPRLAARGLSIDAINRHNRSTFDIPSTENASLSEDEKLITGSDGPMWYRGYFPVKGATAKASAEDVEAGLERFRVRRIFVGHTVVDRVQPLFDGKIVAVQVYPHRDETTGAPVMEGALRANGRWWKASTDGSREPLP
ncbi:metallophosphoesterase [Novosphingobium album (ex Liu et al. 2023)]|uniref:Metallophosphoesterase n=1 Tax=Novosphingobium album (ex Liu et al. 2023) TaxID=3031130 RepID=A0ABT5WSP6_9SPHN|nr:metallophosphoesterase [Novosphingobium album (ex Liu et al. 2023)]MDE8652874.1 metallophosphoesterase [Novosphingobium album (ex Liu et al. 2023)]